MEPVKNNLPYLFDKKVEVIKTLPFGFVKVAYTDELDRPFYIDKKLLTDSPRKENSISLRILGGNASVK